VGFEAKTSQMWWEKTVHVSDRAATAVARDSVRQTTGAVEAKTSQMWWEKTVHVSDRAATAVARDSDRQTTGTVIISLLVKSEGSLQCLHDPVTVSGAYDESDEPCPQPPTMISLTIITSFHLCRGLFTSDLPSKTVHTFLGGGAWKVEPSSLVLRPLLAYCTNPG
jgi:hypothetical protein